MVITFSSNTEKALILLFLGGGGGAGGGIWLCLKTILTGAYQELFFLIREK